MKIYYNQTAESCVMEFSAIHRHETGIYYCDVQIRNAENNELTLHGRGTVTIDNVDTDQPQPAVDLIVTSALSAVLGVVALVALTIIAVLLVKWINNWYRRRGYEPVPGICIKFC